MDQGIFGNERVMQFFITVKAVAEQCFQQLHALSQERGVAADIAQDSFRVGLSYIEKWNDSIIEQEATTAMSKYPDIMGGYKHTLMQYVRHMHSDKMARVQLTVPPLKHFLHWFLTRAAQSSQLQRMEWVQDASFGEKDIFYREILRQTIARDCLPDNLKLDIRPTPLAAGGTPPMKDIMPSDSISNVPVPPSVVSGAKARAVDQHASSHLMQHLTPSLLRIHTDYPSTTATPCLSPIASSHASTSESSEHESEQHHAPPVVPAPAPPGGAPALGVPAAHPALGVPPFLPPTNSTPAPALGVPPPVPAPWGSSNPAPAPPAAWDAPATASL